MERHIQSSSGFGLLRVSGAAETRLLLDGLWAARNGSLQ